ncbi:hypothetical protein [Paenibacillus sp.]|uniref:hypothetical protein n=1 Tax=Paenibacillus sp. TaxID=58172 RepID=UPI003563CC42
MLKAGPDRPWQALPHAASPSARRSSDSRGRAVAPCAAFVPSLYSGRRTAVYGRRTLISRKTAWTESIRRLTLT